MEGNESNKCNSFCLRYYGAFKDIPWRVYCKKACRSDGESWAECMEKCRALCHKDPIYKGKSFEWTAALDRSPGNVHQCRRCDKACLRGCAAKFHVTEEILTNAIPAKVPRRRTIHVWDLDRQPVDLSSLWSSA